MKDCKNCPASEWWDETIEISHEVWKQYRLYRALAVVGAAATCLLLLQAHQKGRWLERYAEMEKRYLSAKEAAFQKIREPQRTI